MYLRKASKEDYLEGFGDKSDVYNKSKKQVNEVDHFIPGRGLSELIFSLEFLDDTD